MRPPLTVVPVVCLLAISFPSARGDSAEPTLSIQRLRVEPAVQPRTNLVAHGSFEHAAPGGAPAGWNWDPRNTDAAALLVDSAAHSGARSLRVTNGTNFGAHVYGFLRAAQSVRLDPGTSYTLSCFVKSRDPGIAWIGGGQDWRLRLHFPPTADTWQRVSKTFVPNQEERDFVLLVSTESPTQGFWLDDIKLEASDAPTFCVPEVQPESVLFSAPEAQEFSDGPWACRFQACSPKGATAIRFQAILTQTASVAARGEALLDLPPGVSSVVVARRSPCRNWSNRPRSRDSTRRIPW